MFHIHNVHSPRRRKLGYALLTVMPIFIVEQILGIIFREHTGMWFVYLTLVTIFTIAGIAIALIIEDNRIAKMKENEFWDLIKDERK